MGKMDTSDLSERYFDENTILYSVSDRNNIIFGEKTEEEGTEEKITFTPGPGVEAIIHGQNDQKEEAASRDSDEQALLGLWRAYKESNPEGTLADFYQNLSNTNGEVE